VGAVIATEAPKGVLLQDRGQGPVAGWHGLHFHEKGDCSKSDFTLGRRARARTAAAVHGLLNPAPTTWATCRTSMPGGRAAAAEVFTTLVTLKALRDADGSAVVVHAERRRLHGPADRRGGRAGGVRGSNRPSLLSGEGGRGEARTGGRSRSGAELT
jgi:Cu/Zn superoxide dismutase